MPLPAEHLVGRADELGWLERTLDQLDRGRPAAIEVAGEPGIGKTRLLRELSDRAEARGFLVLAGVASELEQDVPFSVFVDAVDEYVAGLDPERLALLDDATRSDLAHVFPSLVPPASRRPVALQHERFRSHRAVHELLERLTGSTPVALVLDDVHWADAASLELLGALLRRPPAAPVLIALGIRRGRLPDRMAAAFDRAARDGTLTRIELGPLTLADARDVLGGTVDTAAGTALYEESGGNPFYLRELARGLDRVLSHPSDAIELSSAIGVPAPVAAALRDEAAMLSTPARALLEGAAVAGDRFEPELAAAAADVTEDAAIDAVDELLQLDLIRETDVPRRFRFRHPLVRRAVYESTPAGWRLRAHERCAEALAARGAGVAARAPHVERSARAGDGPAIAVLREAGEEAARLAPSSAARWFGAALRLLPDTAPSEQRVALLLERARCLGATGRFDESRADLLACMEIAPEAAEDLRVRLATACAGVEHLLGLQQEAHRHLASSLADLRRPESIEAVALMIELTTDALHRNDVEAMCVWAERAVAVAGRLPERSLLAAAVAVRAWAFAFAGDSRRAPAYGDEATALVDGLSDNEVAGRLGAIAHLASAELYLDRFAAAERHARRALQIGRATGQSDLYPVVVVMLGRSLWLQGRPIEAAALFDGAAEAARLAGNVQSLAWNLVNRSFAALALGQLDIALASAEESFELVRETDPGPLTALSAAALAAALVETGRADRAVEVLITRAGGDELGRLGGGWRARFLELLTRAQLEAGERDEAERSAHAARECADAVGLPTAAAMADLAAAALALDSGDATLAAERALVAADAFGSVAAPFDGARARVLAGRALVAAGEPERAAAELQLAAAAFESFGATRYRDQAERELRKLGLRVQHRSQRNAGEAGVASLTERELDVARLVVDRRTNHEIATALFVSQKTVETHLSNIFRKINVSSRADLARAVERVDRAAPA
jgi:DNA-binding CsgD family transcriptional regulator/tetratricopeptide (TPR) repeat protein